MGGEYWSARVSVILWRRLTRDKQILQTHQMKYFLRLALIKYFQACLTRHIDISSLIRDIKLRKIKLARLKGFFLNSSQWVERKKVV